MQEMQIWSLSQKIPWRKKWQPTPVFLPGKSHGQRSLVGYSRWGHKGIEHDLVTKQQQQWAYLLRSDEWTNVPVLIFWVVIGNILSFCVSAIGHLSQGQYYFSCIFLQVMCMCVLVAQSCPTLGNPMDCSSQGSPVPGILQARILEWFAIPFSREAFQPWDRTQASHIVGRFFTIWA